MSQPSAAQQAVEWLQQQLNDLNGIRNATPRDPSFKNWRQATLTVMQRIWPSDQDRQERFRRIPFSPADPRADARTVREWYSRGCQEAARVLNGFLGDIRAQGVPEQVADTATRPTSAEFAVDFPTVDLPAPGEVRASTPMTDEADDMLQLGPSPSGSTPKVPVAPALHQPTPPSQAPAVYASFRPGPAANPPAPPAAAPQAPIHAHTPLAPAPTSSVPPQRTAPPPPNPLAPPPKKGMGARLRDLLGFAQLSAKAFTGVPREEAPVRPAPPARLDIQAIGDELTAQPPPAPASRTFTPLSPPIASAPPIASVPPVASAPPIASAPPALPVEEMREPGASVVMSRPTTLRASIEKVSIESLISAEFRNADDAASTPTPAAAAAPAAPSAPPVFATPAMPVAPAEPVVTAPPATDPLTVPHLSPIASAANVPSVEPAATPVVNEAPPALDPFAQSIADALAAVPSVAPTVLPEMFDVVPSPIVPEAIELPVFPPVIETAPIAAEPVVPPAPVTPETPVESVAPSTPAIVTTTTATSGVFPLPTPSGSFPGPSGGLPMPTSSASSGSVEAPAPSPVVPASPTPAETFAGSPSSIIPLPMTPRSERPRPKRETQKVLPFTKRPVPEPVAQQPEAEAVADAMNELSDLAVDPEEIAQATEDFMRTSPVLGATGRKVQRGGYDDPQRDELEGSRHDDPDAIAVLAMLDELDGLGVPKARHKEARARLEDLAKRIEKSDLEWAVLRKAVWFAMEYPELARRLMPVLLPWIDRAA